MSPTRVCAAWLCAVGMAFAGCAKLTHFPVASFDEPAGIPYYGGAHYLLVHADGKGGIVSKLIYLPDRNQKRVAKPTKFLANLESTLKFTNGTLSKSQAVGDATAIPRAVIQAAGRVASLLFANQANVAGYTVPAPHLYRVTWSNDQVRFVGGPGNVDVQVTLVPEK